MAKRGTLTHRRTRRLAAALHLPPPCALGLMEALWHVTAEHAPAGDVGRLSDEDLCDELYWDQDPGELVAAFVRAGVLERHPEHRLVVHGWSEHADNALRHKLHRARSTFWDGSPPFIRRQTATEHDQTPSDHDETTTEVDRPRQDEIEPTSASNQQPVPATSDQKPTNPPLAPPAPRVGTGGPGDGPGRVYVPGDRLRDGCEVLEVDAEGRPLVVRRRVEGSPPTLTREAEAAVARIVEYASRELGHRFDRAARRRLRERLLGGETEAQIRAGYEGQVRALQELDAEPEGGEDDPPDDDPELRQAMRLLAPPGVAAAPPGGVS